MVIARNCDPFSYFQLPEWYSRSKLPFFLKLPSEELTYDVAMWIPKSLSDAKLTME